MPVFELLRKNKKFFLFLLLTGDIALICILHTGKALNQGNISSFYVSAHSRPYDSLLINTYLSRITEASDDFYKEYYTTTPSVNYYSVTVKEVTSEDRISYVTFTTTPYLGPHDTIGIDEITFSADYLGSVSLVTFNHIINYHLPDNLKDLEKKKVPGKYGQKNKSPVPSL